MLWHMVLEIFVTLKEHTSENYLVGGCVRDYLLSKQSHDYDIVTDLDMEKSTELFTANGWKVKECGEGFLVLNISKNGEQFEIANFRKDGVYLDGRRPEKVEIGTIDEDAQRRDFTVNALYMDPFTKTIVDPTGKGMDDASKRILRFVGKPEERIKEDFLRIFRFYRFLSKGFKPDPKSLKACRNFFNRGYDATTPERVRLEIEKMAGLI